MNLENLHELIQRYENSIDWLYGTEHDELFKWRAMATWRKEWLKPKDAFTSFANRFTAAKKTSPYLWIIAECIHLLVL